MAAGALDYETWDAYCAAEFGTARLALPREERREVVASLRDSGLSTRAISAATGVSQPTVVREIQAATDSSSPGNESVGRRAIQGVNGKTYGQRAPEPPSNADRFAGEDWVRYERFVDFVTTPPTQGIGASVDLVRRIVGADTEALDLLDQAVQGAHGGDRLSESATNVDVSNVGRPTGTTQAAALRRLRKDKPELHADVLAGRLSVHAAERTRERPPPCRGGRSRSCPQKALQV